MKKSHSSNDDESSTEAGDQVPHAELVEKVHQWTELSEKDSDLTRQISTMNRTLTPLSTRRRDLRKRKRALEGELGTLMQHQSITRLELPDGRHLVLDQISSKGRLTGSDWDKGIHAFCADPTQVGPAIATDIVDECSRLGISSDDCRAIEEFITTKLSLGACVAESLLRYVDAQRTTSTSVTVRVKKRARTSTGDARTD